jgi:hypothetical protein
MGSRAVLFVVFAVAVALWLAAVWLTFLDIAPILSHHID